MLCSKVAYSAPKDSGNGRIINISSASVYTGAPNWSHYVTSKAGIIGLTRTMAREVGKDHITVNAIAPHMIVTSGTKRAVADHVQENAGSWGGNSRRFASCGYCRTAGLSSIRCGAVCHRAGDDN